MAVDGHRQGLQAAAQITGAKPAKGGQMKDQREDQRVRGNRARATTRDERRKEDRRKQACLGYCYIEMVGWMDRRENVRRKGNGVS